MKSLLLTTFTKETARSVILNRLKLQILDAMLVQHL
jgi:hypothetical protein